MSILASQNQSSSTSEFQTFETPNPNPNKIEDHGIYSLSSSSSSSSYCSSTATSTADALPILRIGGDSNSCAPASNHFPASLSLPAHHSARSSAKMNKKSWRPRVEASSDPPPHPNGGIRSTQASSSQVCSSVTGVNPRTMYSPASVTAQGSTRLPAPARKSQMVSGNHLLNFHYDPISRSPSWARAPPPPSRRLPKRKPYNKDLFLQANYKFVVLDTGDYAPDSMDPDKMLRWEDIICFKYLSPFTVHCPICLGDPLCPQITSCGHIFCFPCIMQYFLMDQDDHREECWKKCPLCFTTVSSQDLYTIYIENVKQHSVGDIIEFVLLTRKEDSYTLSLKNNEGVSNNEEVLDYFSKFTLNSDVELSVREAVSDLDNWLARADSGLVDDLEKLPYVCAAMEQLEKRRTYWNEHRVPNGNNSCSTHSNFNAFPSTGKATSDVHTSMHLIKGTNSLLSDDKSAWSGKSPPDKINGKSCVVQTADDVDQLEDHGGSSSSSYDDNTNSAIDNLRDRNDRDSYSFYQAIDGQLIILHSINMKCLLHHYGTYDRLPNRICGKILQLEMVTQSEITRKRFRYLSHFSLTTTFQLCEIDIRETLPANAVSPFMDEIKSREKQRKRLSRKEQQEKMKAEAIGLDLVRIPLNVVQSSVDESPTFCMDDFEALGRCNVTSSNPPAFGERQLFSSVARLGFGAGHDSPALKSEEPPQSVVQFDVSSGGGGGGGGASAGTPSFASVTSRRKPEEGKESGKKGRKPSRRVLLSTAGGRRYY